ncbi:MAG: response regulator receiver [Daejeonella sp.]|nr:response regulator receiver [Daejeonella sp.]
MKKQILIVDDEPSILKLLNFLLSPHYELVMKNSGISAFDWLEEGNNPDLIISDLNMPYFDGKKFIHNLKISGFYRYTPVILLSGEEELRQITNDLSTKIDFVLQKPFNPEVLKQAIADIFFKEADQTPVGNHYMGELSAA